ncbi:MAG TPA: hypothetical protein VGT81_16205, partial [Casimicrobiaceae bacterium]|nr:hypothetical protein [Casimicrobiaceae bacterium]
SAWQRSQRLHLVATPHEAQKTVLDQTLRSKRQGVNIARDFTPPLGQVRHAFLKNESGEEFSEGFGG